MSLSAGTTLGRYEIRSQIGVGGMGEVYLAEDTKLRRKVALKVKYDCRRFREPGERVHEDIVHMHLDCGVHLAQPSSIKGAGEGHGRGDLLLESQGGKVDGLQSVYSRGC